MSSDFLRREAFKIMLESDSFGSVQARIADELKRQENACVRAADIVELRRAQGAAAVLRTVLGLPQQIYQEMQPRK